MIVVKVEVLNSFIQLEYGLADMLVCMVTVRSTLTSFNEFNL